MSAAGWLDRRGGNRLASKFAGLVGIAAERLGSPVAQLSGGNQQQVAIARWLERETAVLIVDEPTRGMDVGAKEDIYRLIRDVAANGTAVLVISSEFDELFALCHRLIVMSGGRFVSELDPGASTPEEILRLCSTDSELAAHGDETHASRPDASELIHRLRASQAWVLVLLLLVGICFSSRASSRATTARICYASAPSSGCSR